MQFSAQTIKTLSQGNNPLITPFVEEYKHPAGLSGGLSCAGYDVHMGSDLLASTAFVTKPHWDASENCWVLPARTGCLASTVERFILPNNVAMQYINKSTLARKFINACATQGEPGWEGNLTLELYNQTDYDYKLYPRQPIGQVVFIRLDSATTQPYKGKYQNQEDKPVPAR